MPATNKVATQLLVSPHLRDRARALAIVRRESVAEVNRTALESKGLPGLERQHADELSHLHTTLNNMGVKDKGEAFHYMLTHKITPSELESDQVRSLMKLGLS